MKTPTILMLAMSGLLGSLAAEDAGPAAGPILIDLPPPPAPIAPEDIPTGTLSAPPPAGRQVVIPIAPVTKKVIRAARPEGSGIGSDDTYGGFNDFRLAVTGVASTFSLSYDDAFYNSVVEDGSDSGTRMSIEWIGSPGLKTSGGLLIGALAAYQGSTGETDVGGGTVDLSLWTIEIQLGYGLPLGRSFQIEAVPYCGLGGISGVITGPSGDESPSGFVFDYGLRLNALYTFDSGFQVGVTGAWIGYSGSLEDSAYLNATSFSITSSGTAFGILIGMRI